MNLQDVNIKVLSAEEQSNTIIVTGAPANDGVGLFFRLGNFDVYIMQVHQSMNTIAFFANDETMKFKWNFHLWIARKNNIIK